MYTSFINGSYAEAADDAASVELENPATLQHLGTAACASPKEVDIAVEGGRRAQREWWSMDPAERTKRLSAWAARLTDSATEIAGLDTDCVGRVRREAIADVVKSARQIDFWAYEGPQLFRRFERSPVAGSLYLTCPEPVGVCALLLPANVPSRMLLSHASVALAAGNAVVIKPADPSPLSALHIAEVALDAGLPPGLVNIVIGAADTGAALVAHKGVGAVSFTGSISTGSQVASVAARRFAKVALELGGKSPQVVFQDADFEAACQAITWSVFSNAGQICTAGTRALIHRDIYDNVVARLVELAGLVRIGDPNDDATHIGPVGSRRQFERVVSLVKRGKNDARLVHGGGLADVPLPGYFFEPTIFADVPPEAEVFQAEVFGPVLCVTPFEDERHAVALANDSPYALAANVWTADLRRAFRVAQMIDAGTVWCGTSRVGDPHMPIRPGQKSGGSHHRGLVDVFTKDKLVALAMSDADAGPHWGLGLG